MTLVAVDAVVNVSADALMLRVGIRFRVAVGARENSVITWIGVAGRTYAVRVPVIHREICMVPVRRDPRGGVVARGAGSREARGHVVRIRRAAVVSLVARIAVRGQRRVVVVHVATGAGNGCMRSRQREGCVVVIERRGNPCRRVVANIALLRESHTDVIRAGRALEIFQVTGHASRAGQVIVVVHMAGGAGRGRVCSRQREP